MVNGEIYHKLLTVDGVDGIGKSVMVEALLRAIKNIKGEGEKVIVLSVTQKLKDEKKLLNAFEIAVDNGDLKRMQDIYLAVWNRLMREAEEYLSENAWVILNSSPIRSVAFYKGVNTFLSTISNSRWDDGTITRRMFPRMAVLLKANPELVMKRLNTRTDKEKKNSYDPENLDAVLIRSDAYEKVFEEKYGSDARISSVKVDVSEDDRNSFEDAVIHYLNTYAIQLIINLSCIV